jgi:hypothetical protein
VVAARLIKAGDQMGAAGAGRPGAHCELAGELGLAGGGERCALLVADADPFDAASTNRVRQRVQGVADQPEYVPDTDLLKHTDQDIRNRLRHLPLLVVVFAPGRGVKIEPIHADRSSARLTTTTLPH